MREDAERARARQEEAEKVRQQIREFGIAGRPGAERVRVTLVESAKAASSGHVSGK